MEKGFTNGIEGLDALATPPSSPEEGEKPAGTLAPKVRKSIEKKISGRQVKILKILSEFEAAPTPDALKELIMGSKKLDEMTQLLVEQAEIAEKESQGTIASAPFEHSVLAAGEFGRSVLAKAQSKEPFVPAELISGLKKLITSSGQETPTVVATATPETEKATTTKPQVSEKPPAFDDVQTLEELVKRLRSTPTWETKIERVRGERNDIVTNQEIARVLEERVAEFEGMRKAKNPKAEQRAAEFITSFSNPSLREAVRRSLIARGLLRVQPVAQPAALPENPKTEVPREKAGADSATKSVMTWEEVAEAVAENHRGFERVVGGKTVTVKPQDMATEVRKLVAEFKTLHFQERHTPAERERIILNAVTNLTTNEKLRADVRAAFELKGWLPKAEPLGVQGTLPNEAEPQDLETGGASSFGAAASKLLADLRERISGKGSKGQDRVLGVAYAHLVGQFQYWNSPAFRKKSVEERKREVEQFLGTLSPKVREAVTTVVEQDKVVEAVAAASSPISPLHQKQAPVRPVTPTPLSKPKGASTPSAEAPRQAPSTPAPTPAAEAEKQASDEPPAVKKALSAIEKFLAQFKK